MRDLLSNTPNFYVRAGEYLRGMRDRSMRSGTEFVFFVVLLFLFALINDEISLSCN